MAKTRAKRPPFVWRKRGWRRSIAPPAAKCSTGRQIELESGFAGRERTALSRDSNIPLRFGGKRSQFFNCSELRPIELDLFRRGDG